MKNNLLEILLEIANEKFRSEKIHEPWNGDNVFYYLAVMNEEAGEATKAIIDYSNNKDTLQHVREELVQTAAMCIKMIEYLQNGK